MCAALALEPSCRSHIAVESQDGCAANARQRAEKALSLELEKQSKSRQEAKALPEFRDLLLAASAEARLNELDIHQKSGTEVRYGMLL